MPQYKDNGSVHFSVKLNQSTIEKVAELAQITKRSRSNMFVFLLYTGAENAEPYVEDREGKANGEKENMSMSTSYTDVIESVEDLADEHFNSTFSRSARFCIRRGMDAGGFVDTEKVAEEIV